MVSGKPVTITAVDAEDYSGFTPQPLVVVGSIPGGVDEQSAIANIATADATDEATAVALANATKAKVNAILAALRSAGVIAS